LKKESVRIIAPFFLVLFLVAVTINSFALAQTFNPPQIPNMSSAPSEPSNPGAPKEQPAVTPTPAQPDYTPLAIAIIIVAVIVMGAGIYMISRRKKS